MGKLVSTTEAMHLTGRKATAIKSFFKKMEQQGKTTTDNKNGHLRRLLDIEILAEHYPIIQPVDSDRPTTDYTPQPQNTSHLVSIDHMKSAIISAVQAEREQQKVQTQAILAHLEKSEENQQKLITELATTSKQLQELMTQTETLKAMVKNVSQSKKKKSIIQQLVDKMLM